MADSNMYYFAYASNLLYNRLKNSVPEAEKYCVAYLEGYTLLFNTYSDKWHGYMAQGVASKGKKLWGVVWKIPKERHEDLCRQEGIHKKIYQTIDVDVKTKEGNTVSCFTIVSTVNPTTLEDTIGKLPSPQYKNIMIDGAKEVGLPDEVIKEYEEYPDNGNTETAEMQGGNFDYL